MEVRDAIARYVEQLSRQPVRDHSVNLFEYGVLTSLDVLSLVAFIENTFALEILGDDIDMETFGTIDGLVALITGKQERIA